MCTTDDHLEANVPALRIRPAGASCEEATVIFCISHGTVVFADMFLSLFFVIYIYAFDLLLAGQSIFLSF